MDAILRLAPHGAIAHPLRVKLAQISTGVKDRRIKCLLFDEAGQKQPDRYPPHNCLNLAARWLEVTVLSAGWPSCWRGQPADSPRPHPTVGEAFFRQFTSAQKSSDQPETSIRIQFCA